MIHPLVRIASAIVVALAMQQGTLAADTPSAAPDKLTEARALIKSKKWVEAIDELKRVNDTGSADWNNLMGYSLRKASTPDLAGAEKFYNEALRIDPKHRGALEYSGELYLQTGDLAKAEQRLAALDKACFFRCEEYTELKSAIAQYKGEVSKDVSSTTSAGY